MSVVLYVWGKLSDMQRTLMPPYMVFGLVWPVFTANWDKILIPSKFGI